MNQSEQVSKSWRSFQQSEVTARMLVVAFAGFASGLPLCLTSSTLQAWLSDFDSVSLRGIGALSLLGLPYTLKWAWAPVLDRFSPKGLGRRRGWMVMSQLGVALGLLVMSFGSSESISFIVLAGFWVAFCSATQDIAADAYRIDLLPKNDYALGATSAQYGYRSAMMVSGGLAIMMSDWLGWGWTYRWMAALMMLMALFTMRAPNPSCPFRPPASLHKAFWAPIRYFAKRKSWGMWLALVVLYKFTDAFGLSLNTAFLLRGLAYTKVEVGASMKMTSLIGTLLGAGVATYWMSRVSLYRSLVVFALLQSLAHFGFAYHAWIGGHHITLMVAVIFIEFFMSGMGSVAFVAMLMRLCHKRYAAAQFALLSSIAALGRVLTGYVAGDIAETYGWVNFYCVAVLLGLPSLWLLFQLKDDKMFKNKNNSL